MYLRAKKMATSLVSAALIFSSVSPAYAASIDSVNKTDLSDEIVSVINDSKTMKNIPDEVIGLFNDLGGKIDGESGTIAIDGEEDVYGVYWNGGDKNNLIQISTQPAEEGFADMIPYYLSHELGHFIYFAADMTEEQKDTLQNMYERLKSGDVSDSMTVEEVFADGYADYVTSYGYGFLDSEKQMFDEVEENIKDKYYANHPDLADQRKREDKIQPDFATMPTWQLASYGPEIFYQYHK